MAVGPLQPSGRVIAGGRLLLASLFLIAIFADRSQHPHPAAYVMLAAYAAWSLVITLLVWRDWWQDARLAAPAHVIDVAVFMTMLYSTEGYTSPYFTFFIFILLSAAIRWGWKETAITASALIAIYLAAGLLLGPSPMFEIERFIVRTGHLLIVSAILIWFGANHWSAWPRLGHVEDLPDPDHGDAFVAALQGGMAAIGARRATLLWREASDEDIAIVKMSKGKTSRSVLGARVQLPELPGSLLFDLGRDRVLMRADASQWRFLRASEILVPTFRKQLDGNEGLAVPLAIGTAEGLAIFEDVRALSTDHLEFAPRVAREVAVRLQEAALFAAVEERSMAKARVAVARDLHDSIVQFLAGLGFRLEALNRSPAAKGALGESLADLKDTVMLEQRQLKAFIKGLRTGRPVSLHDLSRDCSSLCRLLSRQWDIDCASACKSGPGSVPLRTQLDIQHLVREGVANAVRHGGAKNVTVSMHREQSQLCLTIVDDGRGFEQPAPGADIAPPASLNGRVREARGELKIRSIPGETSVTIRLPMEEAA